MLHAILLFIQIVSGLCIVALVLLQHGQGADAGAGFGAGASGTVFGARGASTALSRATAIFAVIFMLNSAAMTYLGTRAHERPKTILDLAGQSSTNQGSAGQGAAGESAAPAAAAKAPTGAAKGPEGKPNPAQTPPQ